MYSNWSYSPETPNLGQIRRFLEPCDLEIWRMTLKNNRAPLRCCFQLCAWFHCDMWIQTGVRVRKRLSWVLTSVTLTFDLWHWPFAWTSLLTMVITPENFMMIRWWEHGEKGVTDRQTDRRTDGQMDGLNQSYSCLVAAKNRKHILTRALSKAWDLCHVFLNEQLLHWMEGCILKIDCRNARFKPIFDILFSNKYKRHLSQVDYHTELWINQPLCW